MHASFRLKFAARSFIEQSIINCVTNSKRFSFNWEFTFSNFQFNQFARILKLTSFFSIFLMGFWGSSCSFKASRLWVLQRLTKTLVLVFCLS